MQGLAAVCVILLISTGVLWMSAKTAKAQRDLAKTNYETAAAANDYLMDTIKVIRAEKELAEKITADLIAEKAEIERKGRVALAKKNAELKQLREKYAEVDTFLSIPIPDDFVNEWMRREGDNQNGSDSDVPSGGADGSNTGT